MCVQRSGLIFGGGGYIWSFAIVSKYKKHAKTKCRKDRNIIIEK